MTNKPRILITVTEELYKELKKIAEENNLSISKTSELIIKSGLKRREEKGIEI